MSKESEARQTLHMIERSLGEHGWFGWKEVETLENAINELEELRKRNEPMKTIFTRVTDDITGNFWDEPACPKCKSLVNDEDKFCRECGQKLNWKEKQYDKTSTSPEELNPEDIEDLVARGRVEEIENE